jgi:hypothetical protein
LLATDFGRISLVGWAANFLGRNAKLIDEVNANAYSITSFLVIFILNMYQLLLFWFSVFLFHVFSLVVFCHSCETTSKQMLGIERQNFKTVQYNKLTIK